MDAARAGVNRDGMVRVLEVENVRGLDRYVPRLRFWRAWLRAR